MKTNFLTIDNLPLNENFIELPYINETMKFTGEVSEELNDGYDNFILAKAVITNKKGQTCEGFVRFNHCLENSNFIKNLDCNFYKL
jgi:hypothetical protein